MTGQEPLERKEPYGQERRPPFYMSLLRGRGPPLPNTPDSTNLNRENEILFSVEPRIGGIIGPLGRT